MADYCVELLIYFSSICLDCENRMDNFADICVQLVIYLVPLLLVLQNGEGPAGFLSQLLDVSKAF